MTSDFVLYVTAAYATISIAVLLNGIVRKLSRIATRKLISSGTHNIVNAGQNVAFARLDSGTQIISAAEDAFSDSIITSEELKRFSEISIINFIEEREQTIALLRKVNDEKDEKIRSLLYLCKEALENQTILFDIVNEIVEATTHNKALRGAIGSIIEHRVRRAATELAGTISSGIPVQPEKVATYAHKDVLISLGISQIPSIGKI